MRRIMESMGALALMSTAALCAFPKQKPATGSPQNSIVITFKDGRRQIFSLAEIDRIEFTSPKADEREAGSARFLGDWKVGDGAGGTFVITLSADGQAHKTNGGGGDGKWKLVHGEAQVSWDDGWHDVIRKVGSRYEKTAYSPGMSLSDSPSNVTEAIFTEPN